MTEPTGKGRPTPKRRDSQGRRGPVAPPPQSRREAARRVREQGAARRSSSRTTPRGPGDTRPLLPRDSGPVRALVRDLVDSRRHPAVLLLPAAILPFAAQLLRSKALVQGSTAVWLATLLVAVADLAGTAILVAGRLRKDHPGDGTRRHVGYALMRVTQVRRFRVPAPRVAVGDPV